MTKEIYCTQCGSKFSDSAKYCGSCGTVREPDDESNELSREKESLLNDSTGSSDNTPIDPSSFAYKVASNTFLFPVTIEIPGRKEDTFVFHKDYTSYKGKNIHYKDIQEISYSYDPNAGMIIPGETFRYNLNYLNEYIMLEFSTTLFVGTHNKKQALFDLIYLSKILIEPHIVFRLFNKIKDKDEKIKIYPLTISKQGIEKKRLVFGPQFLSWDEFGGTKVKDDRIILYKHSVSWTNEFAEVSSHVLADNSAILPQLLDYCKENFS